MGLPKDSERIWLENHGKPTPFRSHLKRRGVPEGFSRKIPMQQTRSRLPGDLHRDRPSQSKDPTPNARLFCQLPRNWYEVEICPELLNRKQPVGIEHYSQLASMERQYVGSQKTAGNVGCFSQVSKDMKKI